MKKFLFIILSILFIQTSIFGEETPQIKDETPAFYTAAQQKREVHVFSENNLFGLKDDNDCVIVPAIYQKIIMTGKSGWIIQKKNKYGLMDSKGNYLIKPKYRYADRILGRYIKLGNYNDFGIYNEFGESIIPGKYKSVDLLYGKMFLTNKNFRFGVSDFKGNVLIPNICDDIYMPEKDVMRIKYLGSWYEIKDVSAEKLTMPILDVKNENNDILKEIVFDTGAISGYSVLTLSDYLIKIVSSISPAHEETIDDLILAHGVDTVGILRNFSWLPKYPVTFAKNYYELVRDPFSGPLSDTRNKLKRGIE